MRQIAREPSDGPKSGRILSRGMTIVPSTSLSRPWRFRGPSTHPRYLPWERFFSLYISLRRQKKKTSAAARTRRRMPSLSYSLVRSVSAGRWETCCVTSISERFESTVHLSSPTARKQALLMKSNPSWIQICYGSFCFDIPVITWPLWYFFLSSCYLPRHPEGQIVG